NWRTRPTSATPSATASTSLASPSNSRAWPRSALTKARPWRSQLSRCSERKLCAMPGEIDPLLPDAGSLTRGRFTYFPVVPGRVEFAAEVRRAILRDRPEVIALELPVPLQEVWTRAIARLPELSVILYPDPAGGDDQAIYVPVEPADPFTEAIRSGIEIGAGIVFCDPDSADRPHL